MGSAVIAKEKDAAADGAKVEKAAKAEKAPALPSFKGKIAVVKDGDKVTSVTLTVKDTTYQINLDDNGLKLAGEAADKDVSVQGTVATVPGADGKEVKTITVAKFKVAQPKAAGEGEGKKKAKQQQQ
jgi:hypothetical protein